MNEINVEELINDISNGIIDDNNGIIDDNRIIDDNGIDNNGIIDDNSGVDDDNNGEIDEKCLSNAQIEKLSQKIERYIKQSRLNENDKRCIVFICRQEGDYYTETKTGIHLNINKYSGTTLYKVKEYVDKCEETWKLAEEDALHQQEIRRKHRENETINFFKKRTEDNDENLHEEEPRKIITNQENAIENNPNSNIMINFGVDNKKKPLNEYKGIYQRIMRKSRAIKNCKSIPNSKKKKTTIPIIMGIEKENNYENEDENEDEDENDTNVNNDEEEYFQDVDEHYNDEDNEENDEDEKEEGEADNDEEEDEEEEVSSIIDEDSEAKYMDSDEESDLEDRGELDALTEKYQ